ncbi:PPPDE putative peptidase domain-containing protein [Spinellus fusiger]|nr:PPPDE putative peptidase domain-containing protein [Spinellus fusiger]
MSQCLFLLFMIPSLLNNLFTPREPLMQGCKVSINVYDMVPPSLLTTTGYWVMGIGIYHSGLELNDKEYCFGGHDRPNTTGVFMMEPKVGPPGVILKRSIDMGYTSCTEQEIQAILREISGEFDGTTYSLLTRNCNHFTDTLCLRLTGRSAPAWINRAARIGTLFPCLVSDSMVVPPDLEDEEDVDSTYTSSSLLNNTTL